MPPFPSAGDQPYFPCPAKFEEQTCSSRRWYVPSSPTVYLIDNKPSGFVMEPFPGRAPLHFIFSNTPASESVLEDSPPDLTQYGSTISEILSESWSQYLVDPTVKAEGDVKQESDLHSVPQIPGRALAEDFLNSIKCENEKPLDAKMIAKDPGLQPRVQPGSVSLDANTHLGGAKVWRKTNLLTHRLEL